MSWSPENTIITNIGLEMLAKAQVGIGKLNITKVVTTDTVSTNDANKLLSGDSTQITYKQECEIMNTYGGEVYDAEEEQNAGESRITARVSNEDISETGNLQPYSIHQIIVFARLTDLSDPNADMGEVPYMVAQSDGTPDHMPDFSKNPIAINYDLYILHSGVAKITVKNDVSGYVPQEAFDGKVKEINASIKAINDTKAGENTAGITTFKPWTPVYTLDDEVIRWEKQSSTTPMSGKKSAERFNQYGTAENNIAIGENSHAENKDTVVLSENSHVEGESNYIGSFSPNTHVEGSQNSAFRGKNQHIEGSINQGNGQNTHIEGHENRVNTSDTDRNNHVEGQFNLIESGSNHHVGGTHNTVFDGHTNYVDGEYNNVYGNCNHASGSENTVKGICNTVAGETINVSDDTRSTLAVGSGNNLYETKYGVMLGDENVTRNALGCVVGGNSQDVQSSDYNSIFGTSNTVKSSVGNDISGSANTLQSANYSTITGSNNTVNSSSENVVAGNDNDLTGTLSSVILGSMNVITSLQPSPSSTYLSKNLLVSGSNNTPQGTTDSIMSGSSNTAYMDSSCLISGNNNTSKGNAKLILSGESNSANSTVNSIVLGKDNVVSGVENSFCIGSGNTVNNDEFPEPKGALGVNNVATGPWSYAFGLGLIASRPSQIVVGKYNESLDAAFVVGTGESNEGRKNAFWVHSDTAYAQKLQASDYVKSNKFVYSNGDEVMQIVDRKIAALVDGAPETLNTLKELADALSSAEDVIEALQTYSVKKKFIIQNSELVSSNGVCTWQIRHGFPYMIDGEHCVGGYIVQITDNSGNVVACNLQNSNAYSIAKFTSSSNISANSYRAVIIGGFSTEE